jgi:transcriptional regulator with XRE-family HTH domain
MSTIHVMYGAFLQEIRRSRRLSQGALAEIVGISQPNLSAYERNRRVPSADTLNRLLVACGYELVAQAGDVVIPCPLPRVGWFPDEDDPPRHADDPVDERPAVDVDTPPAERAAVLTAVLELADAQR